MKKMVILIISLLIVLFTVVAIYAYLGGFANLNIRTENAGGETIVYKETIGDYNNLSPITNEIYYYLLNDLKIQTYKGFGIFYDDPQQTEKSQLRADAGCIIEDKDRMQLKGVDDKYKMKTLPITKTILAEFPYKGSVSILLGYLKVFPALKKYMRKHGLNDGPLMAILDVPNKKIIYRKIVIE